MLAFYLYGAAFTCGVVWYVASEADDSLLGKIFVVIVCTLVWPIALGACAGKFVMRDS